MNAANVVGANFAGGLIAGTLAAAATCPLDVARTRRQIEVANIQFLHDIYDLFLHNLC